MSHHDRSESLVRVAVFGCGRFANQTHIPNLMQIEGARVVALCDEDREALRQTARRFGVANTYTDGFEMLEREAIDALFSIVPAYAHRADGVEAAAVRRGIHLFSEKPQAVELSDALAIDAAIASAGVVSSVGFRERYRPLYQEARDRLAGQQVIHMRVQAARPLRPPQHADAGAWYAERARRGGWAMSWGVHAVDYMRFMTGQEVVKAQAFYYGHPNQPVELSQALHLQMDSGATFDIVALYGPESEPDEPMITVYHRDGYLALDRLSKTAWALIVDGQVVRTEDMDPWLVHDRCFIEAARQNDASLLLNDYHDGIGSLAPILAAWESARQGGRCIDVPIYKHDSAH